MRISVYCVRICSVYQYSHILNKSSICIVVVIVVVVLLLLCIHITYVNASSNQLTVHINFVSKIFFFFYFLSSVDSLYE